MPRRKPAPRVAAPALDSANEQEYQPYQHGQHLEPIYTGETLHLNGQAANPFSDTHTPRSSVYYPSSDISYISSSYESMPLATTAEVDHFNHDAEAGALGSYPRASYPRSRSPTPAVDDEDYYVVGDTSVHYTSPPRQNPGRLIIDPEKAAQHRIPYNSMYSSSSEVSYDPKTGHTIVYDPVPATPTSSHHSELSSELQETRHYGPAPTGRVIRRHKTKKRVRLTNGNLVVDLSVPPKLILPRRGEPETIKTRYTAVTCDPDDFERKGFFLRQNENGRKTELFICITMYNVCEIVLIQCNALINPLQEDEVLFCRTLYGVMRNIAHLCTRKNSQTWGPNSWEKVSAL